MIQVLIDFLIKFLPTAIFLLFIIIGGIVGFKRGNKKSIRYLIMNIIVASIYLIIYLILIHLKAFDVFLLKMINLFGGKNFLQNALNVSPSCSSLKEVLVEAIPYLFNDQSLILVLKNNGLYLKVLVDFVYNFVIFFVLWILFLLTKLICKIIISIKHPKKQEDEDYVYNIAFNKDVKLSKKQHLGGMAIGILKSTVIMIVIFSSFGNLLFIAFGGKGDSRENDVIVDGNNDDLSLLYKSLSRYGEYGIFKILNSIDDKNNIPYYLYITDLVFHGHYENEDDSVHETISLRHELTNISSFAYGATRLMFNYGGSDFRNVILGNSDKQIIDCLVEMYQIPSFQYDFNNLIDNLDMNAYLFDFSFAFVQSLLGNCDDPSSSLYSLDDSLKELLQICFKKDYHCPSIPSEVSSSNKNKTLPYLNSKLLIDNNDVKIIFDIAFEILNNNQNEVATYSEENSNDITKNIEMIENIIPKVEKLSIFKDKNKKTLNPVLSRIYSFIEIKYLSSQEENDVSRSEQIISSYKDEDIDWLSEIKYALSFSSSVLNMYSSTRENLIKEDKDPNNIPLLVLEMAKDSSYMDALSKISSSSLLGKLFKTSFVSSYVKSFLSEFVQTDVNNINLPDEIVYEDKDNQHGEIYSLLYLVRLLSTSEDEIKYNDEVISISSLVEKIMNQEEVPSSTYLDILRLKDKNNINQESEIITTIKESSLFRSAISNYLFNNLDLLNENLGFEISLPKYVIEVNSSKQNCSIKKEEFNSLINALQNIDFDLLSDKSDFTSLFNELKRNQQTLASSLILRDSISKYLSENTFGDNFKIIIPPASKKNGVFSEEEFNYLFDFLNKINIDELNSDEAITSLIRVIINNEDLIFSSRTLKATISNYISPIDDNENNLKVSDFSLIVPSSSLDNKKYIIDNELKILFRFMNDVLLNNEIEEFNLENLLNALNDNENNSEIKYLDSKIINATIANSLLDNDDFKDYIVESLNRDNDGSLARLKRFDSNNLWNNEIRNLLRTINEISKQNNSSSLDLSFLDDEEQINSLITKMNKPSLTSSDETLLDVIYSSNIIKVKITESIDSYLEDFKDEKECIKENGYYNKDELINILDFIDELGISLEEITNFEFSDLIIKDNPNYLFNDSSYFQGQTKFDVLTKSTLLQIRLAHVLDNVFSTRIDDFDKVSTEFKKFVDVSKFDVMIYDKTILENTLRLLDDFNLEIVVNDNIISLDFTPSDLIEMFYNDDSLIDKLYISSLLVGVVTKELKPTLNDNYIYHPYSFKDYKMYKTNSFYLQSEMENLFVLLHNFANVSFSPFEISIESISLKLIKEMFYNNQQEFYLLDGYLDYKIYNSSLLIPSYCYETISNSMYLKNEEIKSLINVFISLDQNEFNNLSLDSISLSSENISLLSESEIMRANLFNNSNEDIYVNEDLVNIEYVYKNKKLHSSLVIVSKEEFQASLNSFVYLLGSNNVSLEQINSLSFNDIYSLYVEDKNKFEENISSSDITLNVITNIIKKEINSLGLSQLILNGKTNLIRCYNLSKNTNNLEDFEQIKKEEISNILDIINDTLNSLNNY